jgi:hypothetical protein
MKNKRGIIGIVLMALVLTIAVIIGLLYLQIRFYGIEMRTGNFVVDIKYSPKAEEKLIQNNNVTIENPENTISNSTNNNLLLDINNSIIETQSLSEE